MNKLGVEKAYEEIKIEIGDYEEGHTLLHIFGEELYETRGAKGMSICDESFGFGCFHGFLLRGFADRGLDFVDEAESICTDKEKVKSLTACEHGIGHGILDFLGGERLIEALEICSRLSWKGKISGCQDGVFMEYNLPSQARGNEKKEDRGKNFDSEKPFGICSSVPENFRQACYYSLPQLWSFRIGPNFEDYGELCNAIENTEEKKACFYGLGTIIPIYRDFNLDRSLDECEKMPGEEARVGCIIFASRQFWAFPGYEDLYKRMCIDDVSNIVSQVCTAAYN